MTPADTPAPRQLSDEERALWEKASASVAKLNDAASLTMDPASFRRDREEANERYSRAHGIYLNAVCLPSAALIEAATPDIIGSDDEVYYAEDNFDDVMDDYPLDAVREVWANRQLGQRWAVRIVTALDDDGHPDEWEVQLFDSLQLATWAQQAALASLTPSSTEPAHAD
jgi:hypothetical protein